MSCSPQELFTYDWTIDPGVETYYCGYRTLTEDLYVSDFRPLMPSGTHHVVLGYQDPSEPDGLVPEGVGTCTGTTFGDLFVYVGAVGTQELTMPKGVAVKVPAGKQLVFGLHVVNSTAAVLSGHSGVAVVEPDRSQVEQEAEVIGMGTIDLHIPPGRTTVSGTCTMSDDVSIFAALPHMHLTGTHVSAIARRSDGSTDTLLDADYQFTDQVYAPFDPPVHMRKGDKATTSCSYENPGPNTLTFGESTTGGEMCFTFAYRYPAVAANVARKPGIFPGFCLE